MVEGVGPMWIKALDPVGYVRADRIESVYYWSYGARADVCLWARDRSYVVARVSTVNGEDPEKVMEKYLHLVMNGQGQGQGQVIADTYNN